jgi:hypothetical protein
LGLLGHPCLNNIGCLDLLDHPRGTPLWSLFIAVPCFSASESTIALSPCMSFFIAFFY